MTFDFSQKVAAGDTVSALSAITGSAGLTITGATVNTATAQAFAHVSGGAAGNDYTVQAEVTTAQGDILHEAVTVEIRNDAN